MAQETKNVIVVYVSIEISVLFKHIKDAHIVTATMLINQPEELEEVQVLVAQHRRFVNWCAWGEKARTFSEKMQRGNTTKVVILCLPNTDTITDRELHNSALQ